MQLPASSFHALARLSRPTSSEPAPSPRSASGPRSALFGLLTVSLVACGPRVTTDSAGSETKPGNAAERGPAETSLREKLKPTLSAPPTPAAPAAAPAPVTAGAPSAPWNPNTIFPVPVRPWLPPADSPEKANALPGDLRIPNTAPFSLPETPLPSLPISLPTPLVLPATPLAHAIGPDPARVTVWIATSPAPETRGRPPAWDHPQFTTDPTEAIIRAAPITAPTGLRETPPPFVRVSLPDPFEQINIAELHTPPPEIDAPVAAFFRPPVSLPVDSTAK